MNELCLACQLPNKLLEQSARIEELERQLHDMTVQRDDLIDELAMLEAGEDW